MTAWHIVGYIVIFALGAWIAKNTTWLNIVPGL